MIIAWARFAPSPTGYLHLGGVRTALFNWLFARHHGGKLILRIEDTDRTRSTEEYIQAILEGLRWLGMDWDEGPFRQTDRMELYRQHAEKLLAEGKAYPCYCLPEELEAKRKEAMQRGEVPKYDGKCRQGVPPVPGRPPAIRFKTPHEGKTAFDDLIHGPIEVDNAQLDDLIIVRSDGTPTYNFSVVVDDVTMEITHVIRGDDHIANTPRQIQLYRGLGYPLPTFTHMPMILGPDRARLSKRHGAESILVYRQWGYLPEAMVNYLARLGWSYGDQEIFSLEEMVRLFDIRKVNKSAAIFNPEKLLWLNGYYIRACDRARLAALLQEQLRAAGLLSADAQVHPETLQKIAHCLADRAKTLVEMAELSRYFLVEEIRYDYVQSSTELKVEETHGNPQAAEKFLQPEVVPLFEELIAKLEELQELDQARVEEIFTSLTAPRGLKLVKLAQPVRVALTGTTVSPGLFEVMSILGKEKVLKRLRAALSYIGKRSCT
ncbi:MAG: glutamate--tRNA ligase [Nitrospinae bacterium]|nr:glutamate--tRNA ligase [Nitrospinota bacterium]